MTSHPKRLSNLDQAVLPVRDLQSLTLVGPGGFPIGVTRARSLDRGETRTQPHLPEDAFMVSAQMIDYSGDLYLGGKKLNFVNQRTGEIMFYDYRRAWQATLRSPFHCVNFHVDLRSLNASTEDGSRRDIENLRHEPGLPFRDTAIHGLAQAMLSAFDNPTETNQLFLNHVGWALCAHLAAHYGDLQAEKVLRGGLAPWQHRRALDMINANLVGNISLDDLAAECGLSTSHFARAFKRSIGIAPYQLLVRGRAEKAKDLLLSTNLTTVEVATACGFSDQSHLSRVFSRYYGETPAAWRRRQRSNGPADVVSGIERTIDHG